jgi:hypothetical protein
MVSTRCHGLGNALGGVWEVSVFLSMISSAILFSEQEEHEHEHEHVHDAWDTACTAIDVDCEYTIHILHFAYSFVRVHKMDIFVLWLCRMIDTGSGSDSGMTKDLGLGSSFVLTAHEASSRSWYIQRDVRHRRLLRDA